MCRKFNCEAEFRIAKAKRWNMERRSDTNQHFNRRWQMKSFDNANEQREHAVEKKTFKFETRNQNIEQPKRK